MPPVVSELRRRVQQLATLEKILAELDIEPDPAREDRIRASIGETMLRIDALRQAPKKRVEQLRAELERAEREAEEASRG